jgi:hypothetical protein
MEICGAWHGGVLDSWKSLSARERNDSRDFGKAHLSLIGHSRKLASGSVRHSKYRLCLNDLQKKMI